MNLPTTLNVPTTLNLPTTLNMPTTRCGADFHKHLPSASLQHHKLPTRSPTVVSVAGSRLAWLPGLAVGTSLEGLPRPRQAIDTAERALTRNKLRWETSARAPLAHPAPDAGGHGHLCWKELGARTARAGSVLSSHSSPRKSSHGSCGFLPELLHPPGRQRELLRSAAAPGAGLLHRRTETRFNQGSDQMFSLRVANYERKYGTIRSAVPFSRLCFVAQMQGDVFHTYQHFMNRSYALPTPSNQFLLTNLSDFCLSKATITKPSTARRFFLYRPSPRDAFQDQKKRGDS